MDYWLVCEAPPLCRPCQQGQHDACGLDGEPDCLCVEPSCGPDANPPDRRMGDDT